MPDPDAQSGTPREEPKSGSSSRRRAPGSSRSLAATRGPDPDTPVDQVRLAIGVLGAPHGVRGEIKLRVFSDEPEHLSTLRSVYLGDRDDAIALEQVRLVQEGALVKFVGIDTPEAARKLGGLTVRIDGSEAKPLAENEFFLYQLIGLRVESDSGELVGQVVDLIETGANDVLVIQPASGGDQLLVPQIPEYVLEVLPEQGRMVIVVPEYR